MGKKNGFDLFFWVVNLVVSIGIAGLFIKGTFTDTFLLSYLPLVVHQIVGYALIVSAVLQLWRKYL